ncbi:hypothetical protein [Chryseobacterium sp. CFS15]|uniref:hypothetical protein n=1 Tax=Chryseobacterium sp. CFS15 TaxID=2986946 RepID=UPI002809AD91|nr:hypothetical protein [Chryseobacterium sp. CFS15]MDQ8140529.1 hypothetical protein [Chryseobacterium sp. CFS15]
MIQLLLMLLGLAFGNQNGNTCNNNGTNNVEIQSGGTGTGFDPGTGTGGDDGTGGPGGPIGGNTGQTPPPTPRP